MRHPADGSVGATRTIGFLLLAGALGAPAVVAVLAVTGGVGAAGWASGLVLGWSATAIFAVARRRDGHPGVPPADWVTLTRALLSAGVAGLVADELAGRPLRTLAVVTVATIAMVLDGLDGQVARRTRTVTALGARFDGEVDAFLILVLSIAVARPYGAWVLTIGAARYAFLVAGWLAPWLAAPLPYRFWRKVVAAAQGIILTLALSGLVSPMIGMVAVGVALALLAESFGRDVIWLHATRPGRRPRPVVAWPNRLSEPARRM